jgi:hypothetical protein
MDMILQPWFQCLAPGWRLPKQRGAAACYSCARQPHICVVYMYVLARLLTACNKLVRCTNKHRSWCGVIKNVFSKKHVFKKYGNVQGYPAHVVSWKRATLSKIMTTFCIAGHLKNFSHFLDPAAKSNIERWQQQWILIHLRLAYSSR